MDSLGAFHLTELGRVSVGPLQSLGEPYPSWFQPRCHVPLRPVFQTNGHLISAMGSGSSEGTLSTALREAGNLKHSYDYKMFEYGASQVKNRSIKVVKIGSEFRSHYDSFSSTVSLPLLLPAEDPCSFQEPSLDGSGERMVVDSHTDIDKLSEEMRLHNLRAFTEEEDHRNGARGRSEEESVNGDKARQEWRPRSAEDVRRRLGKEERMKREGGKADTPLVRALTWGLRYVESSEGVAKVVEGLPLKLQICSTVIQKLGSEGQTKAALALFHWLQSSSMRPNVYIYNSLLGALKANKEYSMASEVVSWMEDAGVAPDTVTYNTLISVCEQVGDPRGAFRVFETLKASGCQPNLFTFRNLISICKQQGNLRHALDLYGELVRSELELATEREHAQFTDTAASLRKLCNDEMRRRVKDIGTTASPAEVFSVFGHMREAQLEPDGDTYSQTLWACCREPVVSQRTARALLSEMYSLGFKPSVSLCNSLIRSFGQAKKWWAALEIFERMQDVGPSPTDNTRAEIIGQFNLLLSSAQKRRLWKWTLQLLERMEKAGLEPGFKALSTAVITCATAGQTEAALRVFKKMVERGHKPGAIIYGALLSALEKGDLLEIALEVWDHMQRVGIKPNLQAYTTLVVAYGRRGEYGESVRIFEEMRNSGIAVDVAAYNAILTSCAHTGQGLRALDWFHQMIQLKMKPNEVTFQQVIEALANEGQWQAAVDLYCRSRLEGIKPTTTSYDSVMRVCVANGAFVEPGLLGPRPVDWRGKRPERRVWPHCKLILKTAYEDHDSC